MTLLKVSLHANKNWTRRNQSLHLILINQQRDQIVNESRELSKKMTLYQTFYYTYIGIPICDMNYSEIDDTRYNEGTFFNVKIKDEI